MNTKEIRDSLVLAHKAIYESGRHWMGNEKMLTGLTRAINLVEKSDSVKINDYLISIGYGDYLHTENLAFDLHTYLTGADI